MSNSKILESSINIDASLADVWELLIDKNNLEHITSLTVRSDISVKQEKGNGVLTIGKGIFFVNYSPYDLELNGTQAKIRIQLITLGEGSCIMIACMLSDNSILDLSNEKLDRYVYNLKVLAETKKTHTKTKKISTEPEQETAVGTIFKEVEAIKEDEEKSTSSSTRKKTRHISVESERGLGNHFARRLAIIILLLFMLSSLTLATFSRYLDIYDSSRYSELSAAASLQTAKEISFGDKKNTLSYLFSSNGVDIGDNRVVYQSIPKEGKRKPDEYIMVEYSSSNRVKAVSYLNLDVASTYFNLQSFSADIHYDMTIDEVVAKIGFPFTMLRKYYDSSNNYIEEIHLGYLDPTANFDPAWRGEYEIVFNRTKETVVIRNWGAYDGSDPSMRGSIENTPFANQYSDYSDFLNDRFQFNRSQLLMNRYSLGDTKFFFDGEPVHYSDNFGYRFYSIDSLEKLDDTDTPLYRISIGYDYKGAFQMASFSNMRLYNKGGTLKDSNYRLLTRGMTYKEVRSLMNLIPTSVYIDDYFYSICYGRFLDTEVTDEQFEVIVRFGLEDNIAHQVLINTAVSEVTDTDKGD